MSNNGITVRHRNHREEPWTEGRVLCADGAQTIRSLINLIPPLWGDTFPSSTVPPFTLDAAIPRAKGQYTTLCHAIDRPHTLQSSLLCSLARFSRASKENVRAPGGKGVEWLSRQDIRPRWCKRERVFAPRSNFTEPFLQKVHSDR